MQIVETLLGKILSSASTAQMAKPMQTSDVVLVVGATGGVGRRVVDILRKKGSAVRVLVRNKDKATTMLGSDVDMVSIQQMLLMLMMMMILESYFVDYRRHYETEYIGS